MKKGFVVVMCALLVLTGCASAGEGAYVGGQFGHVIGSAIGGIAGGHRGYDWGSLIGTVGGVVAGAAIGSAVDKAQEEKIQKRSEGRDVSDSGINDRISFYDDEPLLEIRNAMVLESLRDGVLTRGEECKVSFEIHNTSDETIYDVRPLVEDVTGNKHIKISPNLLVESIAPHQAVRYSAMILADSQLRNGEIVVMVGVAQGKKEVTSQTRRFVVPTAKKVQ